jgi:CheY-like chemotaxis protein
VIEARDGEEAISAVRDQKPCVVIMDMMMPKVDGLTACYTIKNDPATRDIPVVMLTAIDQELNKKLSTTVMGANRYMTKPFSAQQLLEVVKQLLNGSAQDSSK